MKKVDLFDYTGDIMKALKKGVLISTKNGDKLNAMTISWGKLGIEWNKPIFLTYVRDGRFTHNMLEETGEFSVNICTDGSASDILGFCGTRSGRDMDKFRELGLHAVPGVEIGAPGIKELPLTLECRIIYKQKQDKKAIPEEIRKQFYPEDKGSESPGANHNYHTMFYGEVVNAYIIE